MSEEREAAALKETQQSTWRAGPPIELAAVIGPSNVWRFGSWNQAQPASLSLFDEQQHNQGMSMKTATGKAKVFITNEWQSPERIFRDNEAGNHDGLSLGQFTYTQSDMTGVDGWTQVGMAEIVVKLFTNEEIASRKIASLEEELRKHRVESQKKENHIRESISKLQSIGFSGKIDGVVFDDPSIPF